MYLVLRVTCTNPHCEIQATRVFRCPIYDIYQAKQELPPLNQSEKPNLYISSLPKRKASITAPKGLGTREKQAKNTQLSQQQENSQSPLKFHPHSTHR